MSAFFAREATTVGRVSAVLVAAAAVLAPACAGSHSSRTPAPAPVAAAPAAAPDRPVVSPTFRFAVGDEVGIEIWQEPDLKSSQRILSDGTISPPLLKTTKVVGMTIDEVQDRLNKDYAEFLKFPKVAVRVASIHGDRVFVLGEVKKAQAVALLGPTTALEAIAQAEGFDEEFANRRGVRVIRRGADGQPVVLTVNADAIYAGYERDLPLQRGDVIYVPATGNANWSRSAGQALAPIASIVGIAGGVATLFLAAND